MLSWGLVSVSDFIVCSVLMLFVFCVVVVIVVIVVNVVVVGDDGNFGIGVGDAIGRSDDGVEDYGVVGGVGVDVGIGGGGDE